MQELLDCYEDSTLTVRRLVVGPLANNVFIATCRSTGASVLIDAADEGALLASAAETHHVTKVLTTHGHHDHIGAVREMQAVGVPVGIGTDDAMSLPARDFTIGDGEVFEVGDLRVCAIHTPGHTPGSTCFAIEDTPVLFTGDTLFPGGPGATRGPGSSFPTIIESLSQKLFGAFDDNTRVFPGHGADTTIGDERPHLPEWIARGW